MAVIGIIGAEVFGYLFYIIQKPLLGFVYRASYSEGGVHPITFAIKYAKIQRGFNQAFYILAHSHNAVGQSAKQLYYSL